MKDFRHWRHTLLLFRLAIPFGKFRLCIKTSVEMELSQKYVRFKRERDYKQKVIIE